VNFLLPFLPFNEAVHDVKHNMVVVVICCCCCTQYYSYI